MRFRDGSDSECASNFVQIMGKNATQTLAIIKQAFGEENISHTRRAKAARPRKVKKVKKTVNIILIIFFDVRADCSQIIRLGRPNSQFRMLL
jgi:hypothetical protein